MTNNVRRNVFVSYAHADADWLDRFLKALKPAVSQTVEVWSDRDMLEGSDWLSTIETKLASASCALLLVSDDFLSSRFVTNIELPTILRRHQAGGLNLYWVLLSHVLHAALRNSSLSSLQAAWPLDPPLNALSEPDQDRAIHQICEKLVAESGQLTRFSDADRRHLHVALEQALAEHNRLELGEPIGSGDTSIVYGARLDGRKVAVKVLVESALPSRLDGLEEYIAKINTVSNPSFVELRCLELDARPQFMVLERVDDPCLGRYLHAHGAPFTPDTTARLIRDLACALDEYHERGVCYGPFTSNDVFYDVDHARLRLLAFGVSSFLTASGALGHGFPRDTIAATYLTPEQYSGEAYRQASDVYMLGLIAFELLQGCAPVEVRCLADLERKREFFDAPARFAESWAGLQPSLTKIVLRMLARSHEARPTMKELVEALQHIESEHVALAKAVYQRRFRNDAALYEKFYARFFQRCPEARALFRDLKTQYRKLDSALQVILDFPSGSRLEPTALTHVAEVHREHHITPQQLDHFIASFLDTLREDCKEPEHVLNAFAKTLSAGLDYMRQHTRISQVPELRSQAEL